MNLEDKENLEKLLKSNDFKNIQIGLQLVNSLNVWEEMEMGFKMLAFFQKLTYANRFAEIITSTRNTNTILIDELIPNIFAIEKLYKERNTAKIEEEAKKIFEEAPHIFQFIDWFKLDETKKYVIIQESYWGENGLEDAIDEEDFYFKENLKSYKYDEEGNKFYIEKYKEKKNYISYRKCYPEQEEVQEVIIFQENDFLDLIAKYDKYILKDVNAMQGYSKDSLIEDIVSNLIAIKDNFSNEIKLSKEEAINILQNFHASLYFIFHHHIEEANFTDSEEMIFMISSGVYVTPGETYMTTEFLKVDKEKSFTK